MVAKFVDGLLAHRTGYLTFQHFNPQTVGCRGAKVLGSQDGLEPVFIRRNSRDPSPTVLGAIRIKYASWAWSNLNEASFCSQYVSSTSRDLCQSSRAVSMDSWKLALKAPGAC